jgi:ectoine hydroxylase-related dioxygenase (phytanoyl-CoA dioxygenase family)
MPYYCVDGNDTGSFWIPLDEVDNKNNLKLILGSHKWQKLIRPTKWSNNQSWYQDDSSFMDLPSSEEFEKNILIPELNLGDAVLFNFKTVHGSTGNNTSKSRRAFSMRFIGDDIRYIDRGGPTSPPFDGINLKTGDVMREDWFPKIFSN